MTQNQSKLRFDEVTLMRAILAILIVFMHSFTCYNGSWPEPAGCIDIPVYKFLARFSFAFTLEGFVFISGFLFAFQSITLNRATGFLSLVTSKLKRLLLPSIVFSFFYFLVFYDYKGIWNCIYSVMNGCGHMWYLPMLFWCFVGCWLLLRVNIKDLYKIIFLIVLNLFSFDVLPLRLSNAFLFMFYFYGGYCIYSNREKINGLINSKRIIVSWLIFVVLFMIFRPLRDYFTRESNMNAFQMMLVTAANKGCRLLYATSGLIAFYSTCVMFTKKNKISQIIVNLAATSFGIYIFQQFFLQLLYYKTSLPILVGPYWLPWCGFVVALIMSWGLSLLMLRTKIGRSLIG